MTHRIHGAAIYMVTWIPSIYTPFMLALIYQHGSIMGDDCPRPPRPDQFLHELHKFRLCMRDEPLDACALAPNAGKMLRCQKDGEIMERYGIYMEYMNILDWNMTEVRKGCRILPSCFQDFEVPFHIWVWMYKSAWLGPGMSWACGTMTLWEILSKHFRRLQAKKRLVKRQHLSTKSLTVVSVSPSSSTQIHQTHVNLIMHSQSKDRGFEMISATILAVVGCFWGLLAFDFSIT